MKEGKLYKKLVHPEVIIMVGAVVIFFSWVIQNFVEKKYQMQREKIERTENIINEYESFVNYYYTSANNTDSLRHLLFQKNYLILSLKLFDIVAQELQDTSIWNLEKGRITISDVEKMFEEKQYKKMNKSCQALKETREIFQTEVLIKFYDNYIKVCEKEKTSSWIFVIVYAVGAIVSGSGVYLRKKKEIEKDIT